MRDEANLESTLVSLRRKRKITQKALAQALDVSEQTVRNWEHGKSEPTLSVRQFKTLCQQLGIERVDEVPDSFGPQTENA